MNTAQFNGLKIQKIISHLDVVEMAGGNYEATVDLPEMDGNVALYQPRSDAWALHFYTVDGYSGTIEIQNQKQLGKVEEVFRTKDKRITEVFA